MTRCDETREAVWLAESQGAPGCRLCGRGHMDHRSNQDNDHWRRTHEDMEDMSERYPYISSEGVYWDDPRDIRHEEP